MSARINKRWCQKVRKNLNVIFFVYWEEKCKLEKSNVRYVSRYLFNEFVTTLPKSKALSVTALLVTRYRQRGYVHIGTRARIFAPIFVLCQQDSLLPSVGYSPWNTTGLRIFPNFFSIITSQ